MRSVWTNGCFDILHIGHIKLFEYAKSLGDILVVGIDSDERIKKSKGISRPINNEQNRQAFLQAIRYIDHTVIFHSDDELCSYIKKFNIDTMVVGDEYKTKEVIGSEFCKDINFFPKIPNISTSKILNGY